MSLTVNLSDQAVGKGVHTGNADSMETSGHLVAVLVELTAGVKDRHHDLQGRAMLFRMHSGRDSSSVVSHPYGIVRKDGHADLGTITGHGLIDTVVNHLIDQMMESPLADVAYVHRRSFSDSLQSFQHLNTACGILLFRFLHLFVLNHILLSVFIKCIWSAHKTDKFNKN